MNKIIIFYPSFEKGGVEINTINLLKFFKKKKINVDLITSKLSYKNKKKLSKFSNVKQINKKNKFINLIPNRFYTAFLCSYLLYKELKINNPKDTLILSIQSSLLAIIISYFKGFKVVLRNAADPISSIVHADKIILSFIVFVIRLFVYNFANGVITISNGSKKSLEKFIFNKRKIKVIYNPYLNAIKKFKKRKIKNKTFLSVGRLTKQKDFFTLIKGFSIFIKYYPDYKLNIIGSGKDQKLLISLAKKLSINNNVNFIRWTNNLSKYYLNSDFFVLSSLYEGLGNVYIDAINNSLPCIYAKCKSGPDEILLNNEGGVPFEIKNYKELANKMLFSVQNYNKVVKKTKKSHSQLNRFLKEGNCKIYLDFFLKVMNSKII